MLRCFVALILSAGVFGAALAQDKAKFEPKFEANKSFYQKVSTEVTQTVKVQGGADMSLKHSQTFYFKWTPEKQDGEKWLVKLVVEGVSLRVEIGGNPVTYDSTSENPPTGANAGLAEFFKNLIGSEFKITFSKTGAVEKVEGKDDFVRKLGGANPTMENLLKKMLSDEALKEMSDPLMGLAPSPAAEKAVNDSWEKKTTLPLGPIGSYDRTIKFTYKGKDAVKKELDLIEGDVSLVYKAPANEDGLLFRIKSGTIGIDPANKSSIKYHYNSKDGRLESVEHKVVMTGKLTVSIGNTETEVELYQEQTTKLEGKSDASLLPAKKN